MPTRRSRKENLATKFDYIDKQLAGKQYLMGDKFTVADAYLYTVTALGAAHRVRSVAVPERQGVSWIASAARPKVQEALKAEGLQ